MLASSRSHTPHQSFAILSRLLLSARPHDLLASTEGIDLLAMDQAAFHHLVELAQHNHVLVRALSVFRDVMRSRSDTLRAEWAVKALAAEESRISNAVDYLRAICAGFEQEKIDVTVIKTLDHWPDFGSDIDLYTNASPERVCALMRNRFHATTAPRSWGDRLACKWNFMLPGLPEPVEVHMGRLGQTGEQLILGSQIPGRARRIPIGKRSFPVPAVSDRLMISTLQRMYRHFYFRLCDIVDTATLAAAGSIDYAELAASARNAGIWEGVATYLAIVSDYVRRYSGYDLGLPAFVSAAARFGGDQVHLGGAFLRVPVVPHSARLYGSQLAGLVRTRNLESSARLGLLPWLATAAVVGHKLTGSDKGIW